MFKHILITTDGSELSAKGLHAGLDLASTLKSDVTVVTVTEPAIAISNGASTMMGMAYDPMPDLERAMAEDAKRTLDEAARAAQAKGVPCRTELVHSRPPADAIIETAQTLRADLIVMASHGRRGLSRMLLGSQTAEVLARSPVPVLVIR